MAERRIRLAVIVAVPLIALTFLAVSANASSDPIIVVGDEGFDACGCVDEGEGTEEDPYVIRDERIENPVVGVMLRNTTAHVVVENVTFVADNRADVWLTEAERLLDDEAADPTAFFDASPGFTRGLYFDDVRHVDVRGFQAIEPEQGAFLDRVQDADLAVDLRTSPWNGTESTYQYEAGVAASTVTDVSLHGSATTTHQPDVSWATSPTDAPGASSESDRPTVRLHDGHLQIGPWNATGTTGVDARSGQAEIRQLRMDDRHGSVGVRTDGATVRVQNSEIALPRGAALAGWRGELTVTSSDIETWMLDEVDAIRSSSIRGTDGCQIELTSTISASIVESCHVSASGSSPSELRITDSLLSDTVLEPDRPSRTLIDNTTLRGERTALVVAEAMTLRLENARIEGVPAALQPQPTFDEPARIELVQTELEDSGLVPRPQAALSMVEIEATGSTIDGDPIHVARSGNVSGGHHGAILVPPGSDAARVEDVAVGAGGIHAWGRPGLTVTNATLDGDGFAGVTASFVENVTVTRTDIAGPRHGVLPLRDVDNLTVTHTDFVRTGIGPPAQGTSLRVAESTVNDRPIRVVRSPATVTGPIGQLFALDAGEVTLEDAELTTASPSLVARGTNLTLDGVQARATVGAAVDARDAASVTIANASIDASRTASELIVGEPHDHDLAALDVPVEAVATRGVDDVRLSSSDLEGPLDVQASTELSVEHLRCDCRDAELAAPTLNVTETRIEGRLAHLVAGQRSTLVNVTARTDVGLLAEGPDHAIENLTVRSSLHGAVFDALGRFEGCDATVNGGNLIGSIWKAASDLCDVTTDNVWWGSPGGPAPEERYRVTVTEPRDAPLNRPPSIDIEPREPVVEGEVATIEAHTTDDWMGAGEVGWQLPASEPVGRIIHPVFPDAGSVELQAASTDGFGDRGTQTETITVRDRPRIALTTDPDLVRVGEEANLSADVTDRDGVANVTIDVGADGTIESHDATLTWTFPEAGDWLVAIEAEDEAGVANRTVDVIAVEPEGNEPPQVHLSATREDPLAPTSVDLGIDATSVDDDLAAWRILVDGEPRADGTGQPPADTQLHLQDHGLRSITVEVTDERGALGTDEVGVLLSSAPPQASVDTLRVASSSILDPVEGERPSLAYNVEDPDSETVDVEACLTGALTWCRSTVTDVGDATLQLPRLPAGDVSLKLRILDEAGNEDVAKRTFTVEPNDAPEAELTVTHTNGSTPVQPNASVQDPEARPLAVTWTSPWDTYEGRSPVIAPQQRGVFPLQVEAEDPGGATLTETTLLVVDDAIEAQQLVRGPDNPFEPIRVFAEATWIDGTAPTDGLLHVEAKQRGVVVAAETVAIDNALTAAVLEPDTVAWLPGDVTVHTQIRSPSPPGDPVRDLETALLTEEVSP